MTRAGKSYRSTTPREPKEPKQEKLKRIENYRVARQQARKFIVPGIIAVFLCLFLLFGAMYGFKGTKIERRNRPEDMLFGGAFGEREKEALLQEFRKALSKASDVFGDAAEELDMDTAEISL
ncbi:hypothetical protein BGZ94_008567 [Podila epigama]|nr:hypothetical protein BGZ94_008567 [Podila epigama]